jgi:AraC-like DNA-binding protein
MGRSHDNAVLTSLLASVRLNAAVMFCVRKAGVWELHAPEARHIAPKLLTKSADLVSYHLVTAGSCWAGLTGAEPEELSAGDVLLVPHGDAYTLASSAEAARRGGQHVDLTLFEMLSSGSLAPVLVDDPNAGAENASFVCGFLGCDANPSHPVLAMLPSVVHSRRREGSDDPLELLVRFAMRQLVDAHAGNQVVLLRLAELMFVEVLRRHLGENGTEWLRALMDPVVGRMLVSIHTAPEQAWSLELLAKEAGASRSTASERFTSVIGRPPMQYLMAWRVALAKQMLSEPRTKLSAISDAVGYASEAAFSRAFKSMAGVSPAAWRKSRLQSDES